MGIIEDRLKELAEREQPRVLHQWRGTRAIGSGSGGYECTLCGGWMSALKDPEKYLEGCPGGREAWRQLRCGDRVKVVVPIGDVEREQHGREFVIDFFSKPNNFAVCKAPDERVDNVGGMMRRWNFHPEALERIG